MFFFKKINVKLHGRSKFQNAWPIFLNLIPGGYQGKKRKKEKKRKEKKIKSNPWL
jgi:hypothetical protein